MKYPTNNYMDYQYLYRMDHIEESNAVTLMENLIIRYFKREDMDKFLSLNEIQRLKMILEPEYSDYYFYMIPIVLYILIEYKRYLNNSYS